MSIITTIGAFVLMLVRHHLEPNLNAPIPLPEPSLTEIVDSLQRTDNLASFDEQMALLSKTLKSDEIEATRVETKYAEYRATGSPLAPVYRRRLTRCLMRTTHGETLLNQCREYRKYVARYLARCRSDWETRAGQSVITTNSGITRWKMLAELRSLEKGMRRSLHLLGEPESYDNPDSPPTWGDRVYERLLNQLPKVEA